MSECHPTKGRRYYYYLRQLRDIVYVVTENVVERQLKKP